MRLQGWGRVNKKTDYYVPGVAAQATLEGEFKFLKKNLPYCNNEINIIWVFPIIFISIGLFINFRDQLDLDPIMRWAIHWVWTSGFWRKSDDLIRNLHPYQFTHTIDPTNLSDINFRHSRENITRQRFLLF